MQFAHTKARIHQDTDDISCILREYFEEGGDHLVGERFRDILLFLAGLEG